MLQRAIYVSDATGEAGSNLMSLAEILGVSDANNRRDHVTGILAYHHGQFIQVIEGRRVDLERLIRRLKADPRHSNLRFLVDDAVDARGFGDVPLLRVILNDRAREILGSGTLSDLDAAGAEALLQVAATDAIAA